MWTSNALLHDCSKWSGRSGFGLITHVHFEFIHIESSPQSCSWSYKIYWQKAIIFRHFGSLSGHSFNSKKPVLPTRAQLDNMFSSDCMRHGHATTLYAELAITRISSGPLREADIGIKNWSQNALLLRHPCRRHMYYIFIYSYCVYWVACLQCGRASTLEMLLSKNVAELMGFWLQKQSLSI